MDGVLEAYQKNPSTETLTRLCVAAQNWALRACAPIVGSIDAEDVAQETLIELIRHAERLDNTTHARRWTRRVARNKAIDLGRAMVRRRRRESNSETDESPSEALSEADRLSIHACLSELADEYEEILSRHYFDKMSIRQIAGDAGESPSTVWDRLERAKRALKTRLTQSGFAALPPSAIPHLEGLDSIETEEIPPAVHEQIEQHLSSTPNPAGTSTGIALGPKLLATAPAVFSVGFVAGRLLPASPSISEPHREADRRVAELEEELNRLRSEQRAELIENRDRVAALSEQNQRLESEIAAKRARTPSASDLKAPTAIPTELRRRLNRVEELFQLSLRAKEAGDPPDSESLQELEEEFETLQKGIWQLVIEDSGTLFDFVERESTSPDVVRAIAFLVSRQGQKSYAIVPLSLLPARFIEGLHDALGSDSLPMQHLGTELLERVGGLTEEFYEPLVGLIDSSDPLIQQAAIAALARFQVSEDRQQELFGPEFREPIWHHLDSEASHNDFSSSSLLQLVLRYEDPSTGANRLLGLIERDGFSPRAAAMASSNLTYKMRDGLTIDADAAVRAIERLASRDSEPAFDAGARLAMELPPAQLEQALGTLIRASPDSTRTAALIEIQRQLELRPDEGGMVWAALYSSRIQESSRSLVPVAPSPRE